jgi:tetratricopeptide (TPR) repeat protein
MASNFPTARQVDWISIIPHLVIMGLIILAYFFADSKEFIIYGAATYVMLSYCLRNFIPIDHKVGMRLVHKREFENAIPCFHKSYDFFNKHSWIDRYRYVTLMSSSKMCYKEMALNNIAFCYSQIGDGDKAVEYYNRTLEEYPDNEMARAALNLISSVDRRG